MPKKSRLGIPFPSRSPEYQREWRKLNKDKEQQWECTHPLVRKFSLTKEIAGSANLMPYMAKIMLLKI